MASGHDHTDLRATLLGGSEELYECICDPCHKSGHHYEAKGYCQQCCEYLCAKCYDYHGKLRATQHHVLLDKTTMPKVKGSQKQIDVLTKTCQKHTDKVLEYVCNDHDKICCSVCLNLDHATCTNRSYIPDVAASFLDSEDFKCLQTDLNNLVSMATYHQMMLSEAERQNSVCRSNALDSLTVLRGQIDDMLDKLQNDIIHEIHRISQSNMNRIKEASNDCKTFLTEINSYISLTEQRAQIEKTNQLYIDVKLSIPRVSEILEKMPSMEHWSMTRYKINEIDIQHLKSTLSEVMSLSAKQDSPVTKATFQHEINVKGQDDETTCFITGIAIVGKDHVVVTDQYNSAVKLIDGKKNQIISSVKLSSKPHDITKTEPSQVAIVLSGRKIELFKVSDTLTSLKVLHLPGSFIVHELCYNGEVYAATCSNPNGVKTIDMFGNIVQTFNVKHYEAEYYKPTCIAVSRDPSIAFLTDMDANTITTLSLDDGRIISELVKDELKSPLGVAVGRYGEVFVCSLTGHTIHQLTPTGQLTRIILDKKQKLPEYPWVIAYNDYDKNIYVSSGSDGPELGNCIRVFTLV